MLRGVKDLETHTLRATDGDVGRVKDLLFDDGSWVVRYLVVETGSWLSSRKVLLSPFAVGTPDWNGKLLPASITKEQVRSSPEIDTDKPVSRQQEVQHLRHYGYPPYWEGGNFWGDRIYPGAMLTGVGYDKTGAEFLVSQAEQEPDEAAAGAQQPPKSDPHLRSANEMLRYHIEATDGGMGVVKDLLIESDTWAVRYLIVETSQWWTGHHVLVSTQWIQEISWPDATLAVNLTREAVRNAPRYELGMSPNREHELGLHEHYGRAGYWSEGMIPGISPYSVIDAASRAAQPPP